MSVRYIDAHCHVQFDQYAPDQTTLIEKMRDEGVAGIVVGCNLETSKAAIALAETYDHLFASVGLHPNREVSEHYDMSQYQALAAHPKVVAIGECGLDYYRPTDVTETVKAEQKELFRKQVALAREAGKPLIIHARPSKGTQDAYHDLIEILQSEQLPSRRGDIHFFVGGVEEGRALVALGFTLSFTAVVTFARDYDEVIRAMPLTAILAETDAPYVAPASRRGQRNDPLSVIDVVAKIAEIRSEDPELVRTALLENTQRVFGV